MLFFTLAPDSSILLKWLLESKDEQDRDAALKLRESWLSGKCGIVLPSLMKSFKVTFYDASYHAAAIRYSGRMITADEAYYRKTSGAGYGDTLTNWANSSE